mmetsp:Transcript_37679/g.80052  ORF Transcript_37679/g.80052 Transcript_37679/m.80052 type:complete len:263 (-) Transcript_37679:338-1126(-)
MIAIPLRGRRGPSQRTRHVLADGFPAHLRMLRKQVPLELLELDLSGTVRIQLPHDLLHGLSIGEDVLSPEQPRRGRTSRCIGVCTLSEDLSKLIDRDVPRAIEIEDVEDSADMSPHVRTGEVDATRDELRVLDRAVAVTVQGLHDEIHIITAGDANILQHLSHLEQAQAAVPVTVVIAETGIQVLQRREAQLGRDAMARHVHQVGLHVVLLQGSLLSQAWGRHLGPQRMLLLHEPVVLSSLCSGRPQALVLGEKLLAEGAGA